MIVLACVRIIIVSQLRQVVYSLMAHLQNGNADCHIIGCLQVRSMLIKQVSFIDVYKKLSVECSQMACHERVASIFIACYGRLRERSGVANTSPDSQKIAVNKPRLFALEDCIEQL